MGVPAVGNGYSIEATAVAVSMIATAGYLAIRKLFGG